MWGNYLQNVRAGEVRWAAKYANTEVGITVVSLTDREGKHVNTWLEKEEMLRHESLPPNKGERYYQLAPAISAHTRVNEQTVERA